MSCVPGSALPKEGFGINPRHRHPLSNFFLAFPVFGAPLYATQVRQ